MSKIKGPITLGPGVLENKKVKDWIKKNGIKLPFDLHDKSKFEYANVDLDDFLCVRTKDGKRIKYKRNKKDWEPDTEVSDTKV